MRVAVLGQGSIGTRHAGLLRELGCDVVTYDPVAPGTAAGEAEALEGADAAIVASPTSEHARQAALAIDAGVPVLVEKPLALDAATAADLAARAETHGVPLGIAMNLRFHPGVRAVREALPSAGRPLRAAAWCGSYLPGWRPGTDYRESYSAQRALGGGVLLDAVHEIDYLTWLLGPATSVSALLPKVSDLELDVEDVALLQLELASGAVATITLDYVDRSYHRGCRIVGRDGTVAWEWGTEQVRTTDGVVEAPADAAPTYRAELEHFLVAVRDGTPPSTMPAEAVHTLAIVDAARRSADEGRRVEVAAA